MKKNNIIIGKNSVLEALKTKRKIEMIMVSKMKKKQGTTEILNLARSMGISIVECDTKELDKKCDNSNHQGVIAIVPAYEYASVDDILKKAKLRNEKPFIIIADKIEDPHNLGAIIRTAECAGAHGVIIPQRRAAEITYTVNKTSAGAVEHVLVAKVRNISQTVDDLKKIGIWVFGMEADGNLWTDVDFTGASAIVVGSEGNGLSRLVREKCDMIVSLPLKGKVTSLNASVAGGIMMYEVVRQRNL